MRVEWAKMKARADHWHEEILLTTEEMRRTLEFLEWRAMWWMERLDRRSDAGVSVDLLSGLRAYAAKQANIQRGLAFSFAHTWYPTLVSNHIPIEWPSKYIPSHTT